ncbi:MAG: protein kinase [Thermoleophilia bacterium]|nr:protein kinase [Thermoleophilia bacterium]
MASTGEESGARPLLKNRYRLDRVLGRGGMCIVYQAWDTKLHRHVAIKRLEPPLNQDPRTRARFDREGRALAQLSHPNLVTLIDRGSTETDDYLVFEYIEGRSLKEIIREGPLSFEEVGRIAGQVAEGLAAAHARGIIHRDIKPQNILIDRAGTAKVTDFGIAIGPDWTRVTRAGSVIGSARYMSPEQIRGRPVDARSDIYSLGVVMYEMLTGHPPFDGTNVPEIARQHLTAAPRPIEDTRPDIPAGLSKVVMRCLEKLPEDRFSSMDELLGALTGLGLYSPRPGQETTSSRRLLRRSESDAEREVFPSVSYAPGTSKSDEDVTGEALWLREHSRRLARRRRRARVLKGVGVLVLLVAIALAVALPLTLGGVEAPAVVGLTVDEAKAVAEEKGITVEVVQQVPTFDQEAGVVLGQEPAAAAELKENILKLTVSRRPIPVAVAKLRDYDPEGDQTENPNKLPNLIDDKESSVWVTELYRSKDFGGLKSGVGIDFTLEEEATMVEIVSTVEGWAGQLLKKLSSGTTAKLADLKGQATQFISLREPITEGRLWFTKLAPVTNTRWGVEIAEIRFYR